MLSAERCSSRSSLTPAHHPSKAKNWVQRERVSGADSLLVHIVLRHDPEKRAEFSAIFDAVTDPRSPLYGQYLKVDDVTDLLGPDPKHAAAVKAMLVAYGVAPHEITVNRNRCGLSPSSRLGTPL
jgi:hypothetical protein